MRNTAKERDFEEYLNDPQRTLFWTQSNYSDCLNEVRPSMVVGDWGENSGLRATLMTGRMMMQYGTLKSLLRLSVWAKGSEWMDDNSEMKEVREKYGPYSIIIPYMPNEAASRLFSR